jgi:predicted RNA-binding Zn-ribbon protein involved in translation (DUF1610 family)
MPGTNISAGVEASAITCPSCGSRDLRRSATRRTERIRRNLLGGDPFRCRQCGWRGWRTFDDAASVVEKKKSKAPAMDPTAALGAAVLIALIAAAVGLILAFNS